jgi:hypothetical protein
VALRAIHCTGHCTGHCYGYALDQPQDRAWFLGILMVLVVIDIFEGRRPSQ